MRHFDFEKQLEWIGAIPGKRESRRFEGDYMISQSDVIEQKQHADAVSFGGWAVDLHPADGVYSDKPGCTQYHSKGVYQIPYRCLYSRDIDNLFLAGRIISATHVAFGSTRVMMTTAHNAQVVGIAAAICSREKLNPRDLLQPEKMHELQQQLLRSGHYIPHIPLADEQELGQEAEISASSELNLAELPASGSWAPLDRARALIFPAKAGKLTQLNFQVKADVAVELQFELRISSQLGNYTPDVIVEKGSQMLQPGVNTLTLAFDAELEQDQYVFYCLQPAEGVQIALSDQLVSGLMTLHHQANEKVAKSAVQLPPPGSGFDSFEFWLPQRRPEGQLFAATFNPPLNNFGVEQLQSPYCRPFIQSNTWVADCDDTSAKLTFSWKEPQSIQRIICFFDVDYDHAMESVQYGHAESTMPFCLKHFRLLDQQGHILFEEKNNHQGRVEIIFDKPVHTELLQLQALAGNGGTRAVCAIKIYNK